MVSLPGLSTAGEVFALIRDGQASTRADVGRLTGLSRTAVAARVNALLTSELVTEGLDATEEPQGAGRPPMRLHFNADAGLVLAVAIGRSRTQVGVCNLAGIVVANADIDQEILATPDELMPTVVKLLKDLLKGSRLTTTPVLAVGASIPGTVDIHQRTSLDSPVMAGWDGVPLAPYFASLTDGPVFIDNDANAMAISETRGHLESHRNLIFLKASTGLGVGIVAEGQLLRGRLGAAGEIGHTKLTTAESADCRCGEAGCLEAVAGGWALVRRATDAGLTVAHVRDLAALAQAGDTEARKLIREAGRRTGEALAAAVNLLNPEAIVVGGDLAAVYDTFVAGLRETLYASASALATRELSIVPLTHGEQAGVVGCAALALGHILAPTAIDRRLSDTN